MLAENGQRKLWRDGQKIRNFRFRLLLKNNAHLVLLRQMGSEGLLQSIRTDFLVFQPRLTLLRFYKSFETQIFAVGVDGDRAAFTGGEDGGAVGLPALDHFFVRVTEH